MWWDTLPAALTAPLGEQLRSNSTVDVAIVGAGYTGLWTAYHLQKADPTLRIAIIEAEVAGYGASGRNGGWASALFPVSIDAIARSKGREAAIAMKRAMFKTVDDIDNIATHEGWEIDWAKGGTIVAARTPLQWESAQQEVADSHQWGFASDLLLLDAAQAQQRIRATDTLGATFTPHCAAMNPAKLVRSLAYTVRDRGVVFHENTKALAIEPGRVHTTSGSVTARFVVRATEGYTKDLAGQKREIAPVYSLMLATEPLSAAVWEEIGLAQRETFSDGRHLIIYGQRTADDRIAFGGRGAPYYFWIQDFSQAGPQSRHSCRTLASSRRPFSGSWLLPSNPHMGWPPGRSPRLVGILWAGSSNRTGVVRWIRRRWSRNFTLGRPHLGRSHYRARFPDHRTALGGPPIPKMGARAAALVGNQRGPEGHDEGRCCGGPDRSTFEAWQDFLPPDR
jgi:glycine/D-amino acid oxidase-like deaminating enzyme